MAKLFFKSIGPLLGERELPLVMMVVVGMEGLVVIRGGGEMLPLSLRRWEKRSPGEISFIVSSSMGGRCSEMEREQEFYAPRRRTQTTHEQKSRTFILLLVKLLLLSQLGHGHENSFLLLSGHIWATLGQLGREGTRQKNECPL